MLNLSTQEKYVWVSWQGPKFTDAKDISGSDIENFSQRAELADLDKRWQDSSFDVRYETAYAFTLD